jgi:protein-tyrosine-phosphatase/peptidoglycan/xylan/chitin deacetylase (PgdA/CDA1 family)/carbamoylphosphate synthase large subunit
MPAAFPNPILRMSEMTHVPNQIRRALVLDRYHAALESVQSLGRAGLRCDLVAAEPDCLAFSSRYIDRRIVHPGAPRAEFPSYLGELDQERHYEVVIPSTEDALLQVLKLPQKSDLRRRAVLASNEAIAIALDKRRTLELAERHGVPFPSRQTIRQTNDGEDFRFPVVLKPIHSRVWVDEALHSLVPVIARDREERSRALEHLLRYCPVLEQEYVAGDGIGIELLFDQGKMVWHFAHERIHELPLTGGISTYRRSIAPPAEALDFSERLLGALGWHGVAMVEFKRRPDGSFVLMEINPRLWGSLALAGKAGVDFPLGLLRIARGEKPGPQPRYKTNYYCRAMPDDLIWTGLNFLADHRDPLLNTRSRARTFLEHFRPLAGHESWDHFSVDDSRVSWAIVRQIIGFFVKYSVKGWRRLTFPGTLRRHHSRVVRRWEPQNRPAPKLLFLCHGNICRSPVAERLAARLLSGGSVTSAGFHAEEQRPCPEHISALAAEWGLNVMDHRSRRVTAQDLKQADLILVMDTDTFKKVRTEFPWAVNRTTLLGFFGTKPDPNVRDPYNLSLTESRSVLRHVESSVEGLASWLTAAVNSQCATPVEGSQEGIVQPLSGSDHHSSSFAIRRRERVRKTSLRELTALMCAGSGLTAALERRATGRLLMVLNYHRIGDAEETPYDSGTFSASAEQFDAQITYLKQCFRIVGLEEACETVAGRPAPEGPSILITFDDGYRDNYTLAFQILRSHSVPACFFLPTAFVGTGTVPWWDLIAYVVKQSQNRVIHLQYPQPVTFDLKREGLSQTIIQILELYKSPNMRDQERFLSSLEDACGTLRPQTDSNRRFLSWDEAREMQQAGMAFGSHTHTHEILSKLPPEQQEEELRVSRETMERQLARPVSVLAYPVGERSTFSQETTMRLLERTGYSAAFSHYGGVNLPGETCQFDVRRYGVTRQSHPHFRLQTAIRILKGSRWNDRPRRVQQSLDTSSPY